MSQAATGIREAVNDAVHEFESEWGNLEHTVEVNLWGDGGWQIEVYHTAGHHGFAFGGIALTRRLSTLLEDDGDVEHREYMWRPDEIQEVVERR